MTDLFDRLNRETNEYNARNVDRFNPSTAANYSYFDPNALNMRTFYANNGAYSKHY